MTSAVNGIRGALSYLQAEPQAASSRSSAGRATSASPSAASSPRTSRTGRRRSRLPKPTGDLPRRPARRRTDRRRRAGAGRLPGGHPVAATLFQCHSGAEGVGGRHPDKANASCNAVFPKLGQHPEEEQGPRPHPHRRPRRVPPLVGARRVRGAQSRRRGRRLRLELLLEGLGRAARLRVLRNGLPVRTRQHAPSIAP